MWSEQPAPEVEWSDSFAEAAWIGERLHPFGRDIGSVVPDGFGAYVALLHAERRNELGVDVLERLVQVLREHTSTPDRCWFCIWEGYAWLHGGHAVSGNPPGLVPPGVRDQGRVRLPFRDYYLYTGDVAAATAFVATPWDLRPNLWWPDDQAWCVATDIDGTATYVAGTRELAAALRTEPVFNGASITPSEPFQNGRDYFWPDER